jgi:hypothetical protein
MSSDEIAIPAKATIDAALAGLRSTVAADGYELDWSLEPGEKIGIRVTAGPDACAECLVPPDLMRSIVDNELTETRYRVGSISVPATS